MKRTDIKTLHDLFEYYRGIPKGRWCEEHYTYPSDHRCHCALGHLGETNGYSPEIARKIKKVYIEHYRRHILHVNDSKMKHDDFTPKGRILDSLNYLMYETELGPDFKLV